MNMRLLRLGMLFLPLLLCSINLDAAAHEKYGVIDREGHYVIPADFEVIQPIGPDLFACNRKVAHADFSGLSDSWSSLELYDKNFHRIKTKLPSDCTIVESILNDSYKSLQQKILSAQSYFAIRQSGRCGLLNGRGEEIIKPEYDSIGFSPHSKDSPVIHVFASKRNNGGEQEYKIRRQCHSSDVPSIETAMIPAALQKEKQKYDIVAPMSNSRFVLANRYKIANDGQSGVRYPHGMVDNTSQLLPVLVVDENDKIIEKLETITDIIKVKQGGFIAEIPYADRLEPKRTLQFYDNNGKLLHTATFLDTPLPRMFANGLTLAMLLDRVNNMTGEFSKFGVLNEDGSWLFDGEQGVTGIASPTRFIVRIAPTHFDSLECKTEEGSFAKQFHLLLRDYDLKGMSRAKFLDLVGMRDASKAENGDMFYTIGGFHAHCGNAYSCVVFHFDKDDKLVGWRNKDDGMSLPVDAGWHDTNMIYKDEARKCLVEKYDHTTPKQK